MNFFYPRIPRSVVHLIFKNLSSWNFSLLLPFHHCFGYILCLFLKNSYDFYIENHPKLKWVISPSDIKSWCIRKTIFSHWQKVALRAESGKLVQLKFFLLKKSPHLGLSWGPHINKKNEMFADEPIITFQFVSMYHRK